MKKLLIFLGVVSAVVVLPPLMVPICFNPWSEINCQHQEINIQTGQARYTSYLWYVPVSERTEDTPLSLALQGETVELASDKLSNPDVEPEPWHRANTFSFAVGHSPHYRYHAALSQSHTFGMIATHHNLTSAQQQAIAWDILTRWQQSRDDSGADEVMDEWMNPASAEN